MRCTTKATAPGWSGIPNGPVVPRRWAVPFPRSSPAGTLWRRPQLSRSGPAVLPLHLKAPADGPLTILAIGAHPDDIEIGAGGTLLSLAAAQPGVRAHYLVLTGTAERQEEARGAAAAFLPGAELSI